MAGLHESEWVTSNHFLIKARATRADDARVRGACAFEPLEHVVFLESFDRVPVQMQLRGDILYGAAATALPHIEREALSVQCNSLSGNRVTAAAQDPPHQSNEARLRITEESLYARQRMETGRRVCIGQPVGRSCLGHPAITENFPVSSTRAGTCGQDLL